MENAFCRVSYIQHISTLNKEEAWAAFRDIPWGLTAEGKQWCEAIIICRVADILNEVWISDGSNWDRQTDFVQDAHTYLTGDSQK